MAKKKEAAELNIVSVTRSFSRKLNMSVHGGKQYETADISCEMTASIGEEDVAVASSQLIAMCMEEVEATIAAIDNEVVEEEKADEEAPRAKKKKTLDVGVKAEQDEMEEIAEYVNDLTMAKTPADLKAAVIKIKENSSKMNDTQKKYLSAYYAKRKEKIS